MARQCWKRPLFGPTIRYCCCCCCYGCSNCCFYCCCRCCCYSCCCCHRQSKTCMMLWNWSRWILKSFSSSSMAGNMRSISSGWTPELTNLEQNNHILNVPNITKDLSKVIHITPGLVVMGGDYWMDIFSHLFVVRIVMFVRKDKNKWKRGRGWPI